MLERNQQRNSQLKSDNYHFAIVLQTLNNHTHEETQELLLNVSVGRQIFQSTKSFKCDWSQQSLLPLNAQRLNFVVFNYKPQKTQGFVIRLCEVSSQQGQSIAQSPIDCHSFIVNFQQSQNGAFKQSFFLSNDFILEAEVYVQKNRYSLEKLVKFFKSPRKQGQKSTIELQTITSPSGIQQRKEKSTQKENRFKRASSPGRRSSNERFSRSKTPKRSILSPKKQSAILGDEVSDLKPNECIRIDSKIVYKNIEKEQLPALQGVKSSYGEASETTKEKPKIAQIEQLQVNKVQQISSNQQQPKQKSVKTQVPKEQINSIQPQTPKEQNNPIQPQIPKEQLNPILPQIPKEMLNSMQPQIAKDVETIKNEIVETTPTNLQSEPIQNINVIAQINIQPVQIEVQSPAPENNQIVKLAAKEQVVNSNENAKNEVLVQQIDITDRLAFGGQQNIGETMEVNINLSYESPSSEEIIARSSEQVIARSSEQVIARSSEQVIAPSSEEVIAPSSEEVIIQVQENKEQPAPNTIEEINKDFILIKEDTIQVKITQDINLQTPSIVEQQTNTIEIQPLENTQTVEINIVQSEAISIPSQQIAPDLHSSPQQQTIIQKNIVQQNLTAQNLQIQVLKEQTTPQLQNAPQKVECVQKQQKQDQTIKVKPQINLYLNVKTIMVICVVLALIIVQGILFQEPEDIQLPQKIKEKKTAKKQKTIKKKK